jgi:F0F1-type ATP synthase assembly protein I
MGLVLVATVGVGIGIGMWLDSRLGTTPWLAAAGLLLGAAAGFLEMWQMASRMADDE